MTTQEKERAQGSRRIAMNGPRERLLAAMPLRERRLKLAGVSTAVLEGGEGPPVVLLHGPVASATHWMRVVPGLVATHRVIVPDLPDHGASEVLEGVLDAARVLAWLGELVQRTCASPPTLVAQTLGGAIAARFAIDRGDRIRRLVLIDALGLSEFRPTPEFAQALTRFLAEPTPGTHEGLWRHCAFDLDALRRRMGELWEPFEAYNLDRARSARVRAAVSILMEQLGAPPIPPLDLARIPVPTTLVWGRHHVATPPAIAEAASVRYGWPLHVIEDAGDPPVEQPEALLRALRATFEAS